EEPHLRVLSQYHTVYHLAQAAIDSGRGLAEVAEANRSPQTLGYDAVYERRSPWQWLPPFDHPEEPGRCLVSGTGLTHKASAENRQSMHVAGAPPPPPALPPPGGRGAGAADRPETSPPGAGGGRAAPRAGGGGAAGGASAG